MHISEVAVRRPITTFMFFIAIVLIGVISYFRIPVNLLPDLSYPRLTVWTRYSSVPPQEIERRVTKNIENTLLTVKNVKTVTSISQEGLSLVRVDFEWGTNMDFTTLIVREQLDRTYYSSFPDADRPIIIRVDPSSQPIMSLSLSGDNLVTLKEYAQAIVKRRLEQVDGVALATVTGGLDREIHVDFDADRLLALGVSSGDIANALSAANSNRPGGFVRIGEYRHSIRTLGEFTNIDQLYDVVVGRSNIDAGIIYLRDVATVEDEYRERDNITRFNGDESIGVILQKDAGSNTVQVSESILEVLDQLKSEFPEVSISIAYNQAEFISSSIWNVVLSIVYGGVLAFLVLFLFLHDPRNPINISIAIPFSIIATFALLFFTDVSFNIMSLGGLALGVGLLVDNSIIVLENIFRHKQEGKDIITAAIDASKEISMAVSASTFTTIAVFFPIIFVEGISGQLFRDQSLTITFSLICSLLVSLTLLPMLASHFFVFKKKVLEPITPLIPVSKTDKNGKDRQEIIKEERGGLASLLWYLFLPFKFLFYNIIYRYIIYYFFWRLIIKLIIWQFVIYYFIWRVIFKIILYYTLFLILNLLKYWVFLLPPVFNKIFTPVFNTFDKVFEIIIKLYEKLLSWALDNRPVVLICSLLVTVFAYSLALTLDRELMPKVDQNQFEIEVFLPVGSTLEQTDGTVINIVTWLMEIEDVESVFSSAGIVQERGLQSERSSSLNRGLLLVRLKDEAVLTSEAVIQQIRDKEYLLPNATVNFSAGETTLQQVLGTDESDIVVNIKGEDFEKTLVMMSEMIDKMREIDGLEDIHSSYEEGKPEIRISVKRDQTDRYGLSVRQVSDYIANSMGGSIATHFQDFDKKIDVLVRPYLAYRDEFDDLLGSYIPRSNTYIPVRELINFEFTEGPNEIRRENQVRQIQVFANIHERDYKKVISDLTAKVREIEMPSPEYSIEIGGENEEMQRSFRSLFFAMLISITLVYMILAAQFESLLQPFVIMFAVPLALIGVALALYITGNSLNIMSAIGMIILVGIVVNDAIIKVDFINQARRKGMPLRQAIEEAGRKRFRPILMTTATTVLALLPMALGLVGKGAGIQVPMAVAVIGGLLSSTFLTLLVIPVIYSYIGGFKVKE
ncbi:efflux RND transporter permease subunit [candidate division KSB1 bacterium]